MRVIAGSKKKMKLYVPGNSDIRPTTDRTKEALFSIIGPEISEYKFLDLFSGTASVALEAASRGALEVVAVEKSQEALKLINKNIEKTQLDIKVIKSDVFKYLTSQSDYFDIIFLDPPYNLDNIEELLKLIINNQKFKKLILEFPSKRNLEVEGFTITQKKYGKTSLYIMQKKEENNE